MAPGRSLLGAAKWRASYFEETEMTKFTTAPHALAFAAAIALLAGALAAGTDNLDVNVGIVVSGAIFLTEYVRSRRE